jgi:hypothetical protein
VKHTLLSIAGVVAGIALILGMLGLVRRISRPPSVIISNRICNPPCWNGITPGFSTSDDVFRILGNTSGVDLASLGETVNRRDEVTRTYWYFARPVEDGAGTVYYAEDRVMALRILTLNTLTVGEILDKLGQPEQYWLEIGQGERREFAAIALLYPTQGYGVEVVIDLEGKPAAVELKSGTPVFSVTYFDPARFDDLLQTNVLISKPVNARTGSLLEWPGLGPLPVAAE